MEHVKVQNYVILYLVLQKLNSPQNLLLVQIYYGIGNRFQFAL